MLKKFLVHLDNFFYGFLIKNLLKTSKLGYGFVVTGAESGVNFEHIYNNRSEGSFIFGKYIDRALLNLPAVQATIGRKDDIKEVLWNEINNNTLQTQKTKILDLASGGARYVREFTEEHKKGLVESVCIDKDLDCVKLGRRLAGREGIKNIRFFRGDIFKLGHLKRFSERLNWTPNLLIASGLFLYFNNEIVERMLEEISHILPKNGLLIFSSYENLSSKKLMRKAMSTSTGNKWVLYYRSVDYWRQLLHRIGFHDVYIMRDRWRMNNVCSARK